MQMKCKTGIFWAGARCGEEKPVEAVEGDRFDGCWGDLAAAGEEA